MNPTNYNTINANSDKLGADRILGFWGFTSGQISAKFRTAVLSQTAERGNSNNLYTANNSTPLQHRAFLFVAQTHPKETA